ncbi:MAG: hypothetical protein R6U96_04730 [Promethearchaeia archaeon]
MPRKIEFYINFKKKIGKRGVQFDVYKSTKFNPAKNSETIKCTLAIPDAYFQEQILQAHFEINPQNPHIAEAKIEDNRLSNLEKQLKELTKEE